MDRTYEVIQEGTRLKLDDGHFVKLTKKIGDGFTAVVFVGEPEDKTWQKENVVIKIAKPQAEPQTYVREEYDTLIDLSNRILMQGMPITPRVFGKGTIADRFFIAMELLPGSPVLGKDEISKLEEREALEAYYLIFSFLEELHEKGITYPDLKIENFFWNPDSKDLKLRVLDFGAMGKTSNPFEDPQCHREILRLGLGLFSSLTGRKLIISPSGEVIEKLSEVLSRYQLSYGTKLLLRRLLNQSRDHRLLVASEVKNEIEGLIKFWEYDQDVLFSKFEANVLRAESIVVEGDNEVAKNAFDDKFACTKRAMSAIDIYQLRFGKSEILHDDTTKKLNALISASSHLQEAKRLLLIREFSNASQRLKTGQAYAQSPEPYHLWQYLFDEARIIRDTQLEAIIEGVEQVVDSYENGKLEAAQLLVTNLIESYHDTSSLISIRNYILFKKYMENTESFRRRNNYQKAIEEFKKAKEAFSSLPNSVDLGADYYKSFLGTLKLLADEAEQFNNENSRPTMPFGEQVRHIELGGVKPIIDYYKRLLLLGGLGGEDQKNLEQVIQRILSKGDINSAFALAEIANHIDNPLDSLKELRESIRLLLRLKYLIAIDDLPNAIIMLEELADQKKSSGFLDVPFRRLFNELAHTNLGLLPDTTLNNLKEISLSLGDTQAQKVIDLAINKGATEIQKRLYPIIRQIELDLLPIESWHSELDQFIDEVQAKSFRELTNMVYRDVTHLNSISNRIAYLSNFVHLDKTLKQKLMKFSDEVDRRKSILTSQSSYLPLIRQHFEEKVNQAVNDWKKYKSGNQNVLNRTNDGEELSNLLLRTVKVMTEAASFIGDFSVFDEIAPDVLAELNLQGVATWEALLPNEDNLPGDVQSTLNNVRSLMHQGQIQKAGELMQRLDPHRQLYKQSISTKVELLKMIAYEKRLKPFMQIINQRQFSTELLEVIMQGKAVPGVYPIFRSYGVVEYLKYLIGQRRAYLDEQVHKLRLKMQGSEEPDELAKRLIVEFINLRQACKFIEGIGIEYGKKA